MSRSILVILVALFTLGLVDQAQAAVAGNHGFYIKDTTSGYRFYDIAASKSSSITLNGSLTLAEGWDFDGDDVWTNYKFDRDDARMALLVRYDANHLYLGITIQDDNVMEVSGGSNWETTLGDAVEIYVDPNLSRDSSFQSGDFTLVFTAGNTYFRYDEGTGGGTTWGGELDGTVKSFYDTAVNGTLSNDSDTDVGWQAEVAIPWAKLGTTAPSHGDLIGLNVVVLERDDGFSPLDGIGYSEDGWDVPFENNRYYKFSGDGIWGPTNYFRVYFVDPSENTAPSRISNLTLAESAGPFSGVITLSAPGNNGSSGWCEGYQIRYSTAGPIWNETQWGDATEYVNAFRPRKAGNTEEFEIIGLTPDTWYWVSVRGLDHAGNLGGISNSLAFSTETAPSDTKDRGFARISPVGRYLMLQDGTPLIGIGDHIAASWTKTNTAWNARMYNPGTGGLTNWRTCGGEDCGLDVIEDYFANTLAANGVNVMRLFLEDLTYDTTADNGLTYLEFPASTTGENFHPAVQDFLDNVLQLAKQNDIYIILVLHDTFYYLDRINTHFPFHQAVGGIPGVTHPNHLFTNATASTAMEKRLETVAGWSMEGGQYTVATHPNILYVDLLNEWDSTHWSTQDSSSRLSFMKSYASAARSHFPNHLLSASTVEWQPQFEKADFLLNGDGFDLIDIHTYTKANRDPKAAGSGDTDLTIRGSLEAHRMIRYYQGNSVGYRPVFVSEFAHIYNYASDYDGTWTIDDDIDHTHNHLWTSLAAGAATPGIRIPGPALGVYEILLPDGMRDDQAILSTYLNSTGIDFTTFHGRDWGHHLSISAPSQTIHPIGTFDKNEGIVYLMQDLRASSGTVSGATLTISGLSNTSAGQLKASFIDPYSASPVLSTQAVIVSNKSLALDLPDFTLGLAVEISAVPEPSRTLLAFSALGALAGLRAIRPKLN